MTFGPDTQHVLEQVERLTGKPVHLNPDPATTHLATVKTAHADVPAHILTYRPGAQGIEYNIAYQCGFIIRLFENTPQDRFGFSETQQGRDGVRRLLAGPNGTLKQYGLPEAEVRVVVQKVLGGLLTQLRSVPIGMRIDTWLWEDYPALRTAQAASVAAQQVAGAAVLAPQVRNMTPSTLFSANAAMNAAYALFADNLLATKLHSIPYRSIGVLDRGQLLLDFWKQTPTDAAHDRSLVDAWGNELGLTDWYQWVPLE